MRDVYKLTVTDERHRHQSAIILRKNLKYMRTNQCIRVQFVVRKDGCKIKNAKRIRLVCVASTSAPTVRKNMLFVDSEKVQFSYI